MLKKIREYTVAGFRIREVVSVADADTTWERKLAYVEFTIGSETLSLGPEQVKLLCRALSASSSRLIGVKRGDQSFGEDVVDGLQEFADRLAKKDHCYVRCSSCGKVSPARLEVVEDECPQCGVTGCMGLPLVDEEVEDEKPSIGEAVAAAVESMALFADAGGHDDKADYVAARRRLVDAVNSLRGRQT